ncbi:MAG TPA: hypothetical protein VFC78_02280 [Tepidisphaeraceae bacterium]|nr:hypothetical protein [Tepidisphaeraceae bacterium]
MTLIVGSIRAHDVILTADGRSTRMENGVVTAIDDHFQKLFPIPAHPVVIAHMGENDLAGEPLGRFLGRFIEKLNAGNFTIQQIADRLRCYAQPAVRARLKTAGSVNGCNLWVAGFSYLEPEPAIVETFWKYKEGVLYTEERRFGPTSVVPGGDGAKQIEPVNWHAIDGKSIRQVRAYHHTLMREATTANVKPNTVGGDIEEIVITPERWKWVKAPRENKAAPATRSFPDPKM